MSEDKWRFFKKGVPQQRLTIKSTGKAVPIEVINPNLGVLQVKNIEILDLIENQIANQSGGWEEITQAEFSNLLSQKKTDLKKPWREEWAKNQPSAETIAPQPSAVPPVVEASPSRPTTYDATVPVTYRPTANRRPS